MWLHVQAGCLPHSLEGTESARVGRVPAGMCESGQSGNEHLVRGLPL